MTGSCREQFRHFVLMSEVSSAVQSCKPPLNHAHSCSLYLFLFPQLFAHNLFPFFSTLLLFFFITAAFDSGPVEVTLLLGTTVFLTLI